MSEEHEDTIPEPPAAEPEEAAAGEELPPEKIDFASFVLSIATNAVMALTGESADERIPCSKVDLKSAAQHIDILVMLEAKTKGNLTKDEQDLLQSILYDLRMKYVDAAQCLERTTR